MKLRVKISNDFDDLSNFQASKKAFDKAGIKISYVNSDYDAIIHMANRSEMMRLYPSVAKSGLSVTDRGVKPYKIFLSEENWNQIPKHLGSEYMNLKDYRTALISHEVAHALGYDHVHCRCVGCPADVRQQPSKGLKGCKPTTAVIISESSPKTSDNL